MTEDKKNTPEASVNTDSTKGEEPTLAPSEEHIAPSATADANTDAQNISSEAGADVSASTFITASTEGAEQAQHAEEVKSEPEQQPITAPINFAQAEAGATPPANTAKGRFSTMGSTTVESEAASPTAAADDTSVQQDQQRPQDQQKPQEQQAPQPQPVMGFAAKSFAHMSSLAPLYLLLLFALHILASIWLPSVYFPVELAHIDVYTKMQAAGQWLVPPASEALGATLPGYYWFMALVDLLPLPDSIYLPVLSAITALIALAGGYTLAVSTNLGKNGSFAAGLLLLSCPLFLVFMHMVGPEMLTAGLFSFALALLFKAWTKEVAPFSFIFGFLFLALATFTGGFLPLWTTILASILLIIWRGTFSRAHQLDAVIGFGVLILSFALWLVFTILGSEHATALDAIMLQGIAPFMPPYWPVPTPWALVFLAFGLLPWVIVPLFASWPKVLGNAWGSLKASRKDNSGPTWLYFVAFIGMACIVFQKTDALFTVVPLVPVLALILAKTVCHLSRLGSNVFFLLLAICLLVCGIIITVISIPATASFWTPYLAENITRMLHGLKGLPILSAVFILSALLLVRFTKRAFPEGALMVMALFFVFTVQPMIGFVAPSLVGHGAVQHALGGGLGTLPPSIAPHMPTHPVGDFPVAPLEGENTELNPSPTPVITAPEPKAEDTVPSTEESVEPVSPELQETPSSAVLPTTEEKRPEEASPVEQTPSLNEVPPSTTPQVQPPLEENTAPESAPQNLDTTSL